MKLLRIRAYFDLGGRPITVWPALVWRVGLLQYSLRWFGGLAFFSMACVGLEGTSVRPTLVGGYAGLEGTSVWPALVWRVLQYGLRWFEGTSV